MKGKKEELKETRGINWRLVIQDAGIGALVWLVSLIVAYYSISPDLFLPAIFVSIITYFRSQQRSRGQAIAEAAFAGSITALMIALFISAVLTLRPVPTA